MFYVIDADSKLLTERNEVSNWDRAFIISSARLSVLLTILAKSLQRVFKIFHMYNPFKNKWWPHHFSQWTVFYKANLWLNKKCNRKPNTIFVIANSMIYNIILFICYVSLTVPNHNNDRKFWLKNYPNLYILTMFY